MIERHLPPWFPKAKEIAARVASPVGRPFAAAKKQTTCELYVYDQIGKDPWTGEGVSPDDVLKALAEAKDATELVVHINSPGGYVFDGIAIANAIRGFKGKKTVCVDGLAASIASIIALAGDKVTMKPGSMFMIHDPAGGIFAFGTADQIEDEARKTCAALRKVRENLIDTYVSATGQTASQVSAWMAAETWMTAAEAQARGFTHEIEKVEEPEAPARKTAADAGELAALRSAAQLRTLKLNQYRQAAVPQGVPGRAGLK